MANFTTTSDTGQAALLVLAETSWGETPTLVASGTEADRVRARALRFTSEDLKIDTTTTVSEEIRDDRQYSDIIPTKIEATGSIKTEMSYGSYDDFLQAAICDEWSGEQKMDTSVQDEAVGVKAGPLLETVAATSTVKFKVGEAVKLSGFIGTEGVKNNGKIVVITNVDDSTANTVKYQTIPPLTVETEVQTAAVVENAGFIQNGLEDSSFSIEKQFNDVDKEIIYRGMSINTASFTVEAESIVTTDWTFIGKSGETLDTAADSILEGVHNASEDASTLHYPPSTNEIVSAGTQDCLLIIDGEEAGFVKSVSSEINNNLRGKTVVCVVGNAEIGQGRFMFTGNLSMYFKDFSIYQKYLDNETASIVFTIGNTTSGLYVFNLPRIKFTESNVVAGGADQDVMVDGAFQALLDPDSGKTLTVTKIA